MAHDHDDSNGTGMTPMSQRTSHKHRIGWIRRVARVSHVSWFVMLSAVSSCLVTSTSQFDEPQPSPPVINANTALATPSGGTGIPVTKMIVIGDETEQVSFTANVRAEDVGRPLSARVFLDYHAIPGRNYLRVGGGDVLEPGTWDDERRISANLDGARIPEGCHNVALVVTHAFDSHAFVPVEQEDTAIVVWWLIKGDPQHVDLTKCPGIPTSSGVDAGKDGS